MIRETDSINAYPVQLYGNNYLKGERVIEYFKKEIGQDGFFSP